jgi:hypothetical protein
MSMERDIAADLLERRRFLRQLLGERYMPRIEEYRQVLRAVHAQRPGQTLAAVALSIAEDMDAAGNDPSMLLAAFVEECGA